MISYRSRGRFGFGRRYLAFYRICYTASAVLTEREPLLSRNNICTDGKGWWVLVLQRLSVALLMTAPFNLILILYILSSFLHSLLFLSTRDTINIKSIHPGAELLTRFETFKALTTCLLSTEDRLLRSSWVRRPRRSFLDLIQFGNFLPFDLLAVNNTGPFPEISLILAVYLQYQHFKFTTEPNLSSKDQHRHQFDSWSPLLETRP